MNLRTGGHQQRTIAKATLNTPFHFQWPTLSADDNGRLLSALCQALQPAGNYKRHVSLLRTTAVGNHLKRKRIEETQAVITAERNEIESIDELKLTLDERIALKKRKDKRRKRGSGDADVSIVAEEATPDAIPSHAPDGNSETVALAELARQVHSEVVLGVNSISNLLEGVISVARDAKTKFLMPNGSPLSQIPGGELALAKPAKLALAKPAKQPPSIIFICQGDVEPSHLYNHLPTLAYLAGPEILVCPLLKGAEPAICDAIGVKRVIALGIQPNASLFKSVAEIVSRCVKPPSLPWLPKPKYLKLNVKTLIVPVGKRKESGRGGKGRGNVGRSR